MKKNYLLIFFIILLASNVRAQFSRYWNESFSTKAALLSGAVVGGYSDETSIYYNPSILSDSNKSSLSFANGLAKIDLIRYVNAMGEDLNVANWESLVASGFLSVGLYPKDNLGLVWKAAIFNKSKFDNSFKGEFRAEENVFEQAAGEEKYLGKIEARTEYNDFWYGVGVAKISDSKFTLGASIFLRYTSLRYDAAKNIEVAPLDSNSILKNAAINSLSADFRGYVWKTTLKLGLNYRLSSHTKLGVVLTVPSVALTSSVDVRANASYVNVVSKDAAQFLPDVILDQTSVSAKFNIKDPLSIAVGIDYSQPRYRLNVTAEWFAKIAPYKMIDGESGELSTTSTGNAIAEEDFLSYAAGGNSIVNVAIGVEKYTKTNRSWLFGVKTDFDALQNFDYKELSNLNTLVNAKSNYYHISAGKNFMFLKYDVLFGLEYSFSRASGLRNFANFTPPINRDPENPYNLEGIIQHDMNFKGDALVVFVGLTLKK